MGEGKTLLGWWFEVKASLPYGSNGRRIVVGESHANVGETVYPECKLRASRRCADALGYGGGNLLLRVELSGEIVEDGDKASGSVRRYIAMADATEMLCADARASALGVIDLWPAPEVVRRYLETGDEMLRLEAKSLARAYTEAVRKYNYDWYAAWTAWGAATDAGHWAAWYGARDACKAASCVHRDTDEATFRTRWAERLEQAALTLIGAGA